MNNWNTQYRPFHETKRYLVPVGIGQLNAVALKTFVAAFSLLRLLVHSGRFVKTPKKFVYVNMDLHLMQ